jgi:glycosyltransferase involved in cell wall biosynthesis
LKVSCVMPACYSDRYVGVALDSFLKQTHEDRELVVLDNNKPGETIEHLVPKDERIKYYRCDCMTIGALRNLGASYATGDIICNWDCDDWSHPHRITAQVERLTLSGKAVTGFHNLLFYDTSNNTCWKYYFSHGHNNHPPYAMGTSQCYTRAWWQQHKYQHISKGEDYWFQKEAGDAGQLDSVDAEQLCIARAHKDSTCPPLFGHAQFPSVPRTYFPNEFFTAVGSSVLPA